MRCLPGRQEAQEAQGDERVSTDPRPGAVQLTQPAKLDVTGLELSMGQSGLSESRMRIGISGLSKSRIGAQGQNRVSSVAYQQAAKSGKGQSLTNLGIMGRATSRPGRAAAGQRRAGQGRRGKARAANLTELSLVLYVLLDSKRAKPNAAHALAEHGKPWEGEGRGRATRPAGSGPNREKKCWALENRGGTKNSWRWTGFFGHAEELEGVTDDTGY